MRTGHSAAREIRVRAKRRELRGEREHEQDEGRRDAEHDEGRGQSRPPRRDEPGAESRETARQSADARARPAGVDGEIGASQEARRGPPRGPPRRPGGAQHGDRDRERPASGERTARSRRPGGSSLSSSSRRVLGGVATSPPARTPTPAAGAETANDSSAAATATHPRAGAERPAHADPPQAAIDLGPRGRREHHAGRDQGDRR